MIVQKYKCLLGFVLFAFSISGFTQSFMRVYRDLHSTYWGINVLSAGNEQTAILGYYYGGGPFTTLVDSTGAKEYTNTNYYFRGGLTISNLTETLNGYVFYMGFGYSNMGNPNSENLNFINDTLKTTNQYQFYYDYYAYTDYINIYGMGKEGSYHTCTGWTHSSSSSISYPTTFISRYDTSGNQVWNNNFGPINQSVVMNSIPTSDSSLAVIGTINGFLQLEKYDINGNLQFDHLYANLINASTPVLLEVKKNILAFGNTNNFAQLGIEITSLSDSSIAQKGYVLTHDSSGLVNPVAAYQLSDTTAILYYTAGSPSEYCYLIVNYRGDSIRNFTLPAYTVSTFDNGVIITALDSTNGIIVRGFTTQGNVVYSYLYTPGSLNIVRDIKPIPDHKGFVLTGSSDNYLLIIRQDTSFTLTDLDKSPLVQADISVYPNPATEIISIMLDGNFLGKTHFELFTITGNKVLEKYTNQITTSISVAPFPEGVYFLRATAIDGRTFMKKVCVIK